MSDFFNSKEESSSSQQGSFNNTSRTVWDNPAASNLLLQALSGAQTSGLDPQAESFFRGNLNSGVQLNPYTQDVVNDARDSFQGQLANTLANVKSSMFGSPVGRSNFAIGNAAADNIAAFETGLANMLNQQFNTDRARTDQLQMGSAAGLNQGNVLANQNILSLLGLTRGYNQSGTSQSTGQSTTVGSPSPFSSLTGVAGGLGGLLSIL